MAFALDRKSQQKKYKNKKDIQITRGCGCVETEYLTLPLEISTPGLTG